MMGNNDYYSNFKKTVRIVFYIVLLCFAVLVYRLFTLQILESSKYVILSDKNRIEIYPMLQKRGRIFSADGKAIARNRQRYRLSIKSCPKDEFCKNLTITASQIAITEGEKQRLLEIRRKTPAYAPIIIKDNLSWEEYAKIAMILYKMNHISLENSYTREYIDSVEFSHVIGYTSRSRNYLQFLSGETGLEVFLDNQLAGVSGNTKIEINALGKKIRVIDSVAPIDGKDVVMTINSEVQKYVYDLISKEKAGACVVLDITDGSVVALVSVPGFDTNVMSSKVSRKQWNILAKDPLKPLFNRATSGAYPPGSIFKIVTVLAALDKGIILPKDVVFCSGSVIVDGHAFHCWKRCGHGRVNAYDALRLSCDCYVFEIAQKLGISAIIEYAQKLGFGAKTGIEIPNESSGLLPNKQWKFLKYRNSWKPYETIITAIGQGALLTTLIQSATMFGKIYSNDYNFKPSLIKKKNGEENRKDKNPINSDNINVIKEALFQVCNCRGTASASCRTSYGISGKTGSSQVKKLKKGEEGMNQNMLPWHLRDHAFFVGCAPVERPKYVVAVMIEHGGSGSAKAAPIARMIFDKLILSNERKN